MRATTFELAFFQQQLHGAAWCIAIAIAIHAFINYTAAVLCKACVESRCIPVEICMQ